MTRRCFYGNLNLADALHKVIPARKADLFDLNMQALQAGKEFAG